MSARRFRYTAIAEAIHESVTAQQLAPGALLPSEKELVTEHAASRVTIRKALELLRSQGLVDSRQGFGWIVATGPVLQSLDTLDTLEQQLANAGISGERRVLAFHFTTAPPEVASILGDETVLEVVRLNVADGEPLAQITVWCPEERGAGLSRNDVENSTFHDLLRSELGEARQTISAQPASATAAEVLAVDEGAPLLRLHRITEDRDGQPLLVSEHLYRADRMEFRVTLAPSQQQDVPAGLRLVEGP